MLCPCDAATPISLDPSTRVHRLCAGNNRYRGDSAACVFYQRRAATVWHPCYCVWSFAALHVATYGAKQQ